MESIIEYLIIDTPSISPSPSPEGETIFQLSLTSLHFEIKKMILKDC